jgi:hypothetical protein
VVIGKSFHKHGASPHSRAVEIAYSGKKIVSAPLMASAKGHIIRPSIDLYDMGRPIPQYKDAAGDSSRSGDRANLAAATHCR